MIFVREASAAVVLVTLTLSLQCAGMATVIAWARPGFVPDVLRLGVIRSAMLIMRLMTAFIGLHVLEILLWAGFYRWRCFPFWESAFYFSAASYATVGYGDVVLPPMWRTLGPVERDSPKNVEQRTECLEGTNALAKQQYCIEWMEGMEVRGDVWHFPKTPGEKGCDIAVPQNLFRMPKLTFFDRSCLLILRNLQKAKERPDNPGYQNACYRFASNLCPLRVHLRGSR